MATVNHVVVPNFPPYDGSSSANKIFNQAWKLTRALKKAGWKYLGSGDNAKDTSGDPELDRWNTTLGSLGPVTNAGAAAATLGTPARGRVPVTGLTGIVPADKGRFLKITGGALAVNNHAHQIEEIVSTSSVKIASRTDLGSFAPTDASETNNGALTWAIRDSNDSAETFPGRLVSQAGGWWLGRGPSTLKIPITAAPTGTFLRGENLLQATTGAEGEMLGWVYEAGTGYLVVSPRVRGTGAGPYGWDTGYSIVGGGSSATVTQNGTAIEYRHEMVIWKSDYTASHYMSSGMIFHGLFDPVADAATLFSALMLAVGCTAPVGPGMGGTGNSFPAHAYVAWGAGTTGGSNSQRWDTGNSVLVNGNAQIMCADCIEESNHSQDGSWSWPTASMTVVGGHTMHGFYRLDDTEPGDLDPYVSCDPGITPGSLYGNNRTQGGYQVASANYEMCYIGGGVFYWSSWTTSIVCWRGWRGVWSRQDFEATADHALSSGDRVVALNSGNPDAAATLSVNTIIREPVRLTSVQANSRMRKGTVRWMGLVQGGLGCDTYDNKQWVQLSGSTGAAVCGPWDGVTVPVTV